MKPYKTLFTLALGAVFLSACDLETEPTTSLSSTSVFNTTTDAEKVLTGAWAELQETFYTYRAPGWSSIYLTCDAMGSDVVVNTRYGYRNAYAMTAIYGKTDYFGRLSWELGYEMINNCNSVIAYIDNATGTESDRNRIKAQALALRGFIYTHFASLYSFAIDKDPDAVCVPIYTEPTDTKIAQTGNPASSISEVYEQAASDLEQALSLMPDSYTRSAKWQVDRSVILGLLSRVYLYSHDWAKARDYSAEYLESNSYIMTESEWKGGFNSVDNDEWVWGHPQTTDQQNSAYHFEYLDTTTDGSYYFSINVDPYFKEKYDDGDYRKELMYWDIIPGGDKSSNNEFYMRNAKFKIREIVGEDCVGDLVMMRNSEMYLINAEAEARLGNTSKAMESLNAIRGARGAKLVTSGDDLVEETLLERRRELWGEGFALIDIIRNQKSVERKAWPSDAIDYTYTDDEGVSHTRQIPPTGHRFTVLPDGSEFTANSKYYLFRIPDSEEQANKDLYSKHPKLDIYK